MWPGDQSKTSDRAVNMGVGVASPLWPGFLLAATAGVAYWGWTRWFRPAAELNAAESDLSAPPAPTEGTPEAVVEPISEDAPTLVPLETAVEPQVQETAALAEAPSPSPEPTELGATPEPAPAAEPEPQLAPPVATAPDPPSSTEPAMTEPSVLPTDPVKAAAKSKTVNKTAKAAAPAPAKAASAKVESVAKPKSPAKSKVEPEPAPKAAPKRKAPAAEA